MRKKVLTMANVKNKKNHQKTKSILVIVLLLVVIGFGYFLYRSVQDDHTTPQKDSTSQTSNTTTIANQTSNTTPADSETKTNTENNNSDTPNATGSLANSSITIEPLTQQNGYVSVRSKIKSSIVGSCYFGFSASNDRPVSRSRTSTANPDNSTEQLCDIDVNEVEFTKLGDWKVTVIFSIGNDKVEESINGQIN